MVLLTDSAPAVNKSKQIMINASSEILTKYSFTETNRYTVDVFLLRYLYTLSQKGKIDTQD